MRTTSTTTSISSQLQPQERREATVTDVRALPSTSTSSPTATTAGVIRLSYYGGGHYDSVVSPLHSDGVTKLPPGEIENARIVRTIHTHTTRRHIEQQQQHHTSSNSSTTGTNNSTTNTIANLEREELEKQHLDQAIQESRRCYLNTAYNDLETCLLQQYASNIDNLSHNMTSIPTKTQYYKENLEENAQPEWNEHPDRKEDPEEGIINMIQKQSENEYYEKEIITSLQNETKYTINNNDSTSHNTTTNKEESDLIDAELMSHIRQESENEAKRKENELIEAALLESTKLSSSNNNGGGSSSINNNSNTISTTNITNNTTANNTNTKAPSNAEYNSNAPTTTTNTNPPPTTTTTTATTATTATTSCNTNTKAPSQPDNNTNHQHIIHLADLKENEALELALKQSLESYTETSNHSTKGSNYPIETSNYSNEGANYANEDELLQFALEASLQGYTSSNYADYIDTYQGHNHITNTDTTSTINQNNPDNSSGMMYYSQEEEGEEMDPDLMLAIAESLRK